jgi:hypothetical protein
VLDFDPNLALIENETGVRDRSHPEDAIPAAEAYGLEVRFEHG